MTSEFRRASTRRRRAGCHTAYIWAAWVVISAGAPRLVLAFQGDEARRQALMENARASAAAIDRRNADQAFQAGLARSAAAWGSSGSPSSSSGNGSGSGSSGGRVSGGGSAASSGPQSVVATRTVRVFVGETLAQSATRLTLKAAAGNAESQYLLGRMNYIGYGVTPNPTEARRLFVAAATQRHIEASAYAGDLLVNGVGGPADRTRGMAFLLVAATAGNPDAQALWGLKVFEAANETNDNALVPRALGMLEQAAAAGKASAQSTLGSIVYFVGVGGVAVDGVKTVKYLRQGAAQGDPICLYNLGNMLVDGHEWTGKDLREGWALLERAVQTGNGRAMAKLGVSKLNGIAGQQMDTVAGARLIRSSAQTGDTYGMFLYANMLYSGEAVAVDKPAGIRYARLAAEAGHGGAQLMMAKMNYFSDVGIPKNPAEAVRWSRLSAESGWADGQLYYGLMLWEGLVVTKDRPAAVAWFQKSAAQGNKAAIENMADPEVLAVVRTMKR